MFFGRLKAPRAGAGVRASIAVGGIFMVVASTAVATDMVTPGQFRNALVAMLPFAFTEPDPPPALNGVIGYGEIVTARELLLSSQVSGRVTQVVVAGDTVREGTTILRIDDTEAQRVVRDAQTDVARAELALARVGSSSTPANDDSRAPAEDVSAVLDRVYVKISDMFPSLPDVVSGLHGILYGGLFLDPMSTNHLTVQADRAAIENPAADGMKLRAMERYEDAKKKHEVAIARLRSVPGNPDDATLEVVLAEANEAVIAISNATKATNDLYSFLKNHLEERGLGTPPVFQKYEVALSEYSSQLDDQVAIFGRMVGDVRSAREGTQVTVPADTALERQEAELELRRAQNALLDARAHLALYDIQAPFDGIVTLETKTAQYVSEGDTVAKLAARDALASISLTQEAVARVEIGQEARLSFPGSEIEIRGRVAEIGKGEEREDGLVYFILTIIIGKDERIRPGMQVVARFLQD